MISEPALHRFGTSLRGHLLLPDHPGYEDPRKIHKGLYNYWKSNYMKSLSDGAIDTLLAFYAKTPSPRTVIVLEHDGDSAFSRVPEDTTAFGHRNWPYNLIVTVIWDNPADTEANVGWTHGLWTAMQPFLADAAYDNDLGAVDDKSD